MPTESASNAWSSGPGSGSDGWAPVTIGSGSHVPTYVSRRDARVLSMSRQIRPTVTVSQPRRSSVPPGSDRCSRIQPSWTASSASVSDPSIR